MTPRDRRIGAATLIGLMTLVFAGTLRVAGASHDISIVDFAFEPAELSVVTGEPVSWTNNGQQTHNVTSVRSSELDSGDLAPGEGYGHVFETPGVFQYQCTIHPDQMQGTITVTAAAATPTSSGPPEPTPPAGTLPPNFSPFPSVGPAPTPTPAPSGTSTPSSTPAPSATTVPGDATGGTGNGPFLALLLIALVVVAVVLALWLRNRRTA